MLSILLLNVSGIVQYVKLIHCLNMTYLTVFMCANGMLIKS